MTVFNRIKFVEFRRVNFKANCSLGFLSFYNVARRTASIVRAFMVSDEAFDSKRQKSNACRNLVRKTEGTNHSEDLDTDGRIIQVIKLTFTKQYVRWWNGVFLLRKENNGGVFGTWK